MSPSKIVLLSALVAGASAFNTAPAFSRTSTALFNEMGAGGMFDTRNPDAVDNEDPRKSISAAPSFEEYMKARNPAAAAPAAPAAPAAAAPAAAAPAAAAAAPATPAKGGLFDNYMAGQSGPAKSANPIPKVGQTSGPAGSSSSYLDNMGGAPKPKAPHVAPAGSSSSYLNNL